MKIDIVLRTHDGDNVHKDWRKRFFTGTKQELLLGCTRSLVKAIQYSTHDINLTVIDDHSADDTIQQLKEIILPVNAKLIHLQERGYNHSAHQQWLLCRDTDADLFYSVEDDYLHCETAIEEMVETYILAKEKLGGQEVVIYPFDAPEEYRPPKYQSFIVHGSRRHWRSGLFTTNVMMTVPKILIEHWERFEVLALKYNGDYLNPRTEHYEESNTIWPLWQTGQIVRLNPIPSLALHMQFPEQEDPFINWRGWWSKYAS